MGKVINFSDFRKVRISALDDYDPLDCIYCETTDSAKPVEVTPNNAVIYQCEKPGCRKFFHFTADGAVGRGKKGRAFA